MTRGQEPDGADGAEAIEDVRITAEVVVAVRASAAESPVKWVRRFLPVTLPITDHRTIHYTI